VLCALIVSPEYILVLLFDFFFISIIPKFNGDVLKAYDQGNDTPFSHGSNIADVL
jgi:hypothetical protein